MNGGWRRRRDSADISRQFRRGLECARGVNGLFVVAGWLPLRQQLIELPATSNHPVGQGGRKGNPFSHIFAQMQISAFQHSKPKTTFTIINSASSADTFTILPGADPQLLPAWTPKMRKNSSVLLRATSLSPDLFEAAVMRAVHKDLMKMIVVELKRELEARRAKGAKGVAASAAARGHRARAPRRLRAVRRASPGGSQNFTVLDDARVLLPF